MGRNEHFGAGAMPPYEDAYYSQAHVHQLPVELVSSAREPGVDINPRRVGAVTRSLRQGNPIREPLHIVKGNSGPVLYDGHHRLEAAKRAGMTHVPVRVTL